MNSLNLHLKELEKEQTKPKVSGRKEIAMIRVEINEIENRKLQKKKNSEIQKKRKENYK